MLSKNQLGFLYMFLSVCAFSIMDLLVKWSDEYPLGQVLFFRGFFGIVIYFFIIPKDRLKDFYLTERPLLHFNRCLFGLIALLSIFTALRNLPLATVVSISFAAPIFSTIFSIFFLGEKVGYYRWLAVFVGFVGIISAILGLFIHKNIISIYGNTTFEFYTLAISWMVLTSNVYLLGSRLNYLVISNDKKMLLEYFIGSLFLSLILSIIFAFIINVILTINHNSIIEDYKSHHLILLCRKNYGICLNSSLRMTLIYR